VRSSHALAVWLFERLGVDAALAGDLLEECARGRSTIWYWKQVLIAIWFGIWGAIFNHKLLALRAVAAGCGVNGIWLFLWQRFLHLGLPVQPPDTKPLMIESVACLLIILFTQTVTGWIVARTHRAHAIPMVVVFVTWLVMWYVAGAFSGKEPRLLPHLAWYVIPISIEVLGLLFGGILGACPKKQPSPPTNPEMA
jgi:DNA-binding transcriptional LysR family regulator